MKLDAIKRQGKRVDLTCGHNGHKLGKKSREELGEQVGESARNVQRYIRLTELIPELLDMVDDKEAVILPLLLIFPTLIKKCRNGFTSISGIQDLSNQSRLQL